MHKWATSVALVPWLGPGARADVGSVVHGGCLGLLAAILGTKKMGLTGLGEDKSEHMNERSKNNIGGTYFNKI